MVFQFLLAWVLAFLLTVFLVPIARRAALRAGIVDRPDGRLKVHSAPVPYLGGAAMYLAFLVTLAVVTEPDRRILAILVGSTLMVMLGLIDDFGSIPPVVKLTGQIITVFVLIRSNIQVNLTFIEIPPWVELAVTFLWVVGLCNAFNIIDVLDGLAAGAAAVSSAFLGLITAFNGQPVIGLVAWTLCGACTGFFLYNRPPASIYMGDAGSLFLGITLGVLAMLADYSDRNPWALFTPVLLFALPLFDTAYVMILRAWRRRPIFHGSKDHFAVRMRIAGWPVRNILGFALAVQGVFAAAAAYNPYATPRGSFFLYGGEFVFFVVFGGWLARVPVTPSSGSEKTKDVHP